MAAKIQPKPVLIGTFYLGNENVRLFINGETGGDFFLSPPDKGCAIINVGSYVSWPNRWEKVMQVLMHELIELSATRLGCRFLPSPCTSNSHAAYIFAFSHEQMDVIAANIGEFLALAIPELSKTIRQTKKKSS